MNTHMYIHTYTHICTIGARPFYTRPRKTMSPPRFEGTSAASFSITFVSLPRRAGRQPFRSIVSSKGRGAKVCTRGGDGKGEARL